MSTKHQSLLLLLGGLFLVQFSAASDFLESLSQLYTDITRQYNKNIRPAVSALKPVNIDITFSLASIQDFDDLTGYLKLTSALTLRWEDSRLSWDPAQYDGLTSTMLAYDEIWTPHFVSLNAPDHRYLPGLNAKVARIDSTGIITVHSLDPIHVICSVNVENYPYDSQSCSLDIYPWGYRGSEVRLTYDNDTSDNTYLIPEFIDSSAWNVSQPEITVSDDGKNTALFIDLTFTRKYTYAVANMIIPVFILSLLNTWVFILPPETGERISYSITVFLSFAVYMTILMDHMPKGAEPLPRLNYQMLVLMIYSVSIMFCTVLSLRMYNNMDKKPVPVLLQKFIHCLMFKKRCCARRNTVSNEHNNGRPRSKTGGDFTNAQRSYINNQRRSSVVGLHQSSTPQPPTLGEDATEVKVKQNPDINNANGLVDDDVTWLDIGSTFDISMLIFHLIWWFILVLLQWLVSAGVITTKYL